MSEPMYLTGDSIALKNSYRGNTRDIECSACGKETEVEVEEEYSHGTTTWYAEWTCKCGEFHISEDWY